MGSNEMLALPFIVFIVVIGAYKFISDLRKPDESEELIAGLMSEIDRLYRLNNFHITREIYVEQQYVKQIKDELKGINNANGELYKRIFNVERPYKSVVNNQQENG
ncbi:MAG: hypothetical protein ACI9C9_002513 [Marivirga sp.]|jgi:hypothetical protein